ncbi:MAG: hypothetical protein NWR72_10990 [Bacteroidia bacterium]|nr:hypothetical protein [Bacteroidia bacterium]
MNILYIHGLDSAPHAGRIDWLEARGHKVRALHIDYRTTPGAYWELRSEAIDHQVDYLIGSSLGGRLGFWLGEDLGIEGLFFNPAIALEIPGLKQVSLQELRCQRRHIILGAMDEIVDPQKSWAWLATREREGLSQRVMMCQWLGHQIDQETYEQSCRWAGLDT